jgi:Kef-type K+ transport system membrane component KefB
MQKLLRNCVFLSLVLFPAVIFASTPGKADPVGVVIFWVTTLFVFGLIGRSLAIALNQPGVIGELLMGVAFGNLCYLFNAEIGIILRESAVVFNAMREMLIDIPLVTTIQNQIHDPAYAGKLLSVLKGANGIDLIRVAYVLDIFSQYGVIFLLFMAGLESSVAELKKTGVESLRVALLGVIAPMVLGFLALSVLLPSESLHSHLFVAATLCATSVGISVRVLQEIGRMNSREARIIVGAAMIDDILGLMLLAIVSSIVINNMIGVFTIAHIILSALIFFMLATLIGPWIIKRCIRLLKFLAPWEAKLFISFIFLMGLAWLATQFQLAPIIGAFAAGIVIHDGFFGKEEKEKKQASIRDLLLPFEAILAPLFFMLIGIQVKLEFFLHKEVLILSAVLIIVGVLGKLISGWGGRKKDDRLFIGIGMVPRGEVGLVFAAIGTNLGIISDQVFSSIIVMVIVTTCISPIWLKKRYESRLKINDTRS